MSANKDQRKFLVVAVILFVAGFTFAAVGRREKTGDNSAGLGACGFAVAGGLALVAAALTRRQG